MSESTGTSPASVPPTAGTPEAASSAAGSEPYVESAEELAYANRPFRGWRLLGVIGIVVLVIAIVSAVVDWVVIGPLEGRVF